LQYHISAKDWDAALEICVTPEEIENVNSEKRKASGGLCACLQPSEATRRGNFVDAIKAYEWEKAASLAKTDDERVDVEESKARVLWMQHYMATGEYDQALSLSISQAEEAEIEEAKAKASNVAPVS
jgi:hypothetical protein